MAEAKEDHARGEVGALAGDELFRQRLDFFKPRVAKRVRELGRDFVGRRWLAQDVRDELYGDDAETKTTECRNARGSYAPFLVIFGESGTGKSAFLGRILDARFCGDAGGPWAQLHRRVLARHICQVQDAESLDAVLWAKSLAGQVFLAAAGAGNMATALGILGHADREAFAAWLEGADSYRIGCGTGCSRPGKLGGRAASVDGHHLIDSLDEALTASVVLQTVGGGRTLWCPCSGISERLARLGALAATSRPTATRRRSSGRSTGRASTWRTRTTRRTFART